MFEAFLHFDSFLILGFTFLDSHDIATGSRKTIPSACRAIVGLVAGGGRMDKPVLKAGNNFHKFRVKRGR